MRPPTAPETMAITVGALLLLGFVFMCVSAMFLPGSTY